MGIEEQNMPPVSNTVKNHPHPESAIPLALFPPPHGAGMKSLNRRRCVQKILLSQLALKPRFLIVARCRFAIRNSRPVAASPVLHPPYLRKITVALVRKSEVR
jgi:hypothetical protein